MLTTRENIDLDALAGGLLLVYRCVRSPVGGYEADFITTLSVRAKTVLNQVRQVKSFCENPLKNSGKKSQCTKRAATVSQGKTSKNIYCKNCNLLYSINRNSQLVTRKQIGRKIGQGNFPTKGYGGNISNRNFPEKYSKRIHFLHH